VDKYGKPGFVTLFLTNFFYELILYYLQSGSSDKNKDSQYFFHYNVTKKRAFTPEELDDFRNDLRVICAKRAKEIVKQLEKENLIDTIELSKDDARLTTRIDDTIREILNIVTRDRGSD
jgi:hypothetical protein